MFPKSKGGTKGESKGDSKGGKDGKGGKGKGKSKKGGKDQAKAVLDYEVSRASAAVNPGAFPRNGIGVDSWANVHMIHQKPHKGIQFTDALSLATGPGTKCSRSVGIKGAPRVMVPYVPDGENVDLFPEGFLFKRGCTIVRGDTHTLTTPKGRIF